LQLHDVTPHQDSLSSATLGILKIKSRNLIHPLVEKSLGTRISSKCCLAKQAGEIESSNLDLNCENTVSTPTIPELLELLDFSLEGE